MSIYAAIYIEALADQAITHTIDLGLCDTHSKQKPAMDDIVEVRGIHGKSISFTMKDIIYFELE